jgi:hypothetical protein
MFRIFFGCWIIYSCAKILIIGFAIDITTSSLFESKITIGFMTIGWGNFTSIEWLHEFFTQYVIMWISCPQSTIKLQMVECVMPI